MLKYQTKGDKMKVKFSSQYLKADEVKKGAIITILDPGKEQESKFTYDNGDPKMEYVFTVEYNGDQKQMRMNTTSRRSMVEAFGDDTISWVGKQAKLFIMPTPKGDKNMIVLDPVVEKEEE
jgi:hypothetical protein